MIIVRPLGELLRLGIGPMVWFAHLSLLYGAQAIVCRPPSPDAGTMLWLGATASALALVALLWLAVTSLRRTDAGFLRGATALMAGLSGLGVLLTAAPIAILPACL